MQRSETEAGGGGAMIPLTARLCKERGAPFPPPQILKHQHLTVLTLIQRLSWVNGFWQIEQGNREQAEYHLQRIASICGTDCYEYRTLAEALEKPPGTGLVY
jgi:hypothetical protein